MAAGTPTEDYGAQLLTQLGTSAVVPTGTMPVGRLAVLFCSSAAGKTVSGVVDTGSNTWAQFGSNISDGTRTISCYWTIITTQLTNASTITVTWSASTSSTCKFSLQMSTGIATTSPNDKQSTNSGTGTTITPGSTGTLSQPAEIAFVAFNTGASPTYTKPTGWTNVTTTPVGVTLAISYLITTATTALNPSATWGTSSAWVGMIVTFKASAFTQAINIGVTLAPSVSKVTKHPKTLSVTESSSVTLSKVSKWLKTISVTTTVTPTVSKISKRFKSISVTVTNAASISKNIKRLKSISATTTLSASLSKISKRNKTLSVTNTNTVSVTLLKVLHKTIGASVTLIPSINKQSLRHKTLSVTSALTASVSLRKSLSKALSVSVTLTPSLSLIARTAPAQYFKAFLYNTRIGKRLTSSKLETTTILDSAGLEDPTINSAGKHN